MYKKTITYTDYNGQERTEDFYFHLSKAELAKMEMSHPRGFEAYIDGIIKADNREELIRIFDEIIESSYGEKDDTGKRFVKSKELTEAFKQTEAYSNLYIELITDEKAAAEFVNGIVPSDLAEAVAKSSAPILSVG